MQILLHGFYTDVHSAIFHLLMNKKKKKKGQSNAVNTKIKIKKINPQHTPQIQIDSI